MHAIQASPQKTYPRLDGSDERTSIHVLCVSSVGGMHQGGADQRGMDQGGMDQGGMDQGGMDQGGTGPPARRPHGASLVDCVTTGSQPTARAGRSVARTVGQVVVPRQRNVDLPFSSGR
jgi:hypothetical protein